MLNNLWFRLLGCLGVGIGAWLMVKFMHVQEAVITSDVLIVILTAAFIIYVLIHTFLDYFTRKTVPVSTPKAATPISAEKVAK